MSQLLIDLRRTAKFYGVSYPAIQKLLTDAAVEIERLGELVKVYERKIVEHGVHDESIINYLEAQNQTLREENAKLFEEKTMFPSAD